MAERPLVIPEVYSGEDPFDAWATHFENVATLNGWAADQRLQWLAVRLVRRPQIAFQNPAADVRELYDSARTALQRRFEPESRRGLYAAEYHARRKQPKEDWASFGEDLKMLVDKAFPDIEEPARERIAVDRFLGQLEDPQLATQLAFSVWQRQPQNLHEAVTSTLEMQSHFRLASCTSGSALPPTISLPVAAVDQDRPPARLDDMLRQLVTWMERLESSLTTPTRQPRPYRSSRGTDIYGRTSRSRRGPVCHRCGDIAHLARNCPAPAPRSRTPPGN